MKKRMIYAFEFSDNYVYVGLTSNLKKRKEKHFYDKKSYVYKHMIKTNIKPNLIKLTEFLDEKTAIFYENYYLKQYSKNNWNILNKIKTGSLGGTIIKHTKIACKLEAKKYKTRREWYEKSASSYDAARRNKWLDECCSHMIVIRKPNGFWTKEKCIEDAKKYNTRSEWQKNSKTIYGIARKNKWLDECSSHMVYKHNKNGFWTKEKCIEDAKKYNTRNEWRIYSSSASTIASKNKWLDECCLHMIIKRKKHEKIQNY